MSKDVWNAQRKERLASQSVSKYELFIIWTYQGWLTWPNLESSVRGGMVNQQQPVVLQHAPPFPTTDISRLFYCDDFVELRQVESTDYPILLDGWETLAPWLSWLPIE